MPVRLSAKVLACFEEVNHGGSVLNRIPRLSLAHFYNTLQGSKITICGSTSFIFFFLNVDFILVTILSFYE